MIRKEVYLEEQEELATSMSGELERAKHRRRDAWNSQKRAQRKRRREIEMENGLRDADGRRVKRAKVRGFVSLDLQELELSDDWIRK